MAAEDNLCNGATLMKKTMRSASASPGRNKGRCFRTDTRVVATALMLLLTSGTRPVTPPSTLV